MLDGVEKLAGRNSPLNRLADSALSALLPHVPAKALCTGEWWYDWDCSGCHNPGCALDCFGNGMSCRRKHCCYDNVLHRTNCYYDGVAMCFCC